MSIFTKIKDAIFGHPHAKDAPTAPSTPMGPPAPSSSAPSTAPTAPSHVPPTAAPASPAAPSAVPPAAAPSVPAAPMPITTVDVEARLDAMKGADRLNWRVSIADLMRLIGLDPSFANRRELAHELGDADYSGTAEENVWLHRQVMNKLAENGGNVPASLRD